MKEHDNYTIDCRGAISRGISPEFIMEQAEDFFDANYWQRWNRWDTSVNVYLVVVDNRYRRVNARNYATRDLTVIDWLDIYGDRQTGQRNSLQQTLETQTFKEELL